MTPCTVPFTVTDLSLDVTTLDQLITVVDPERFQSAITRLRQQFHSYAATSPEPLPAPGLIVTREIRCQCELYLPISPLTNLFNRLYRAALPSPPLLSATPFYHSPSWADTFSLLPPRLQFSANPATLLDALLTDRELLAIFLLASFLPERFYGREGRYPEQQAFIRQWLTRSGREAPTILDAACGTGEETRLLALQLIEGGIDPRHLRMEGWTIEPLEVWCANQGRFPHDQRREEFSLMLARTLRKRGGDAALKFRCADLTIPVTPGTVSPFSIIVCNGLLGGPIISDREQIARTLRNLTTLLKPGGLLLIADHFHGGWKKKCPQDWLRALLEAEGLKSFIAGEGLGACRT